MTAFRTETVDTPAGTYTVELHYDEDSENPLTSWDHEGMAFYVSNGVHGFILDTLNEDAGTAGETLNHLLDDFNDDDNVTRRFAKWAAITGSPWVLVIGSDSASQSDFYRWYVLVNKTQDFGRYEALTDEETIERAARATMSDYRKWAAGEVCGYVVKSPDGDELDDGSVWGFYDDNDALEEGKTVVKYDWQERLRKSWTVGAGFVGII